MSRSDHKSVWEDWKFTADITVGINKAAENIPAQVHLLPATSIYILKHLTIN